MSETTPKSDDLHTFKCSQCGEFWKGGIESVHQFGPYDPCPHCWCVDGSYHDCCEDLQGKGEEIHV